ncbi:MAG TPA: HAD-IB family hydrolase [Acidimicrobiia bacterium]|jgi:HAD superfamily hydrolase (TIGR01490 family)
MANSAAFFDLDRTLISGASAFPLGVEAWRQGLASNPDIGRWAISALSFKLLGDKGDATDDVKGDFLNRIAGASVAALEVVSAAVLPKLVSRVRPESRKLIKMHHDSGRETWIVSAAPHEVVEPLARSLGMTGAIGTKGRVVAGHYTGELDGPFVYGAGKAEAVEKLASDRGYDLERSYAYSDSISDLPMMETVGHPVAVNPDSELDALAHERAWPVVIFARKTKRAIAVSAMSTVGASAAALAYALGRKHGRASALAQMAQRQIRVRKG